MNKVKCKDCRHYDTIRSGQTKNPQHGWCAAKSIYPFKESVGQVFPLNVKRRESAEIPAKPEIVTGAGVVANCSQVSAK
jgi:hypothetical protein